MSDRPSRDVSPERAENRPERVKFHQRNRISLKDRDPNYEYRIVNDVSDRLEEFQARGWEFVHDKAKIGDPIAGEGGAIDSRQSKPVGGGIRGYTMRIRKDWYDEDQQAKAALVKQTEQAIRPDKNQYVPGDGRQAVTDT